MVPENFKTYINPDKVPYSVSSLSEPSNFYKYTDETGKCWVDIKRKMMDQPHIYQRFYNSNGEVVGFCVKDAPEYMLLDYRYSMEDDLGGFHVHMMKNFVDRDTESQIIFYNGFD